jgi:hypothetical protein
MNARKKPHTTIPIDERELTGINERDERRASVFVKSGLII